MQQNKQKFAKMLFAIGEIYNKNINSTLIELYYQILKDYPWSEIQTAIQRHLRDPKRGCFFPKPADLIAIQVEYKQQQAQLAWLKVEHAIRAIGAYHNVVFDDAIIHLSIIKLGGWSTLCRYTRNELIIKAKQFQQYYLDYTNQELLLTYPNMLHGLLGSYYCHQSLIKPIFIGDQTKAKIIYQREMQMPQLLKSEE